MTLIYNNLVGNGMKYIPNLGANEFKMDNFSLRSILLRLHEIEASFAGTQWWGFSCNLQKT